MAKYYNGLHVRDMMNYAFDNGWDIKYFSDTVCGLGSFVLIPPDNNHYNIVVQECYANEWSCVYTVRRCSKISKTLQERIDKFEEECD